MITFQQRILQPRQVALLCKDDIQQFHLVCTHIKTQFSRLVVFLLLFPRVGFLVDSRQGSLAVSLFSFIVFSGVTHFDYWCLRVVLSCVSKMYPRDLANLSVLRFLFFPII
jgi:hypothetical protein